MHGTACPIATLVKSEAVACIVVGDLVEPCNATVQFAPESVPVPVSSSTAPKTSQELDFVMLVVGCS
jgi:hypothetical protein